LRLSRTDPDGHAAPQFGNGFYDDGTLSSSFNHGYGSLMPPPPNLHSGMSSTLIEDDTSEGSGAYYGAQQLSAALSQTSLSDGAKKVGGIVGKLKKWFGRGETVVSVVHDAQELTGWVNVLTSANGALSRDSQPNYLGPQPQASFPRCYAAKGL
jgi:hypothetical protein